ncbi:TMEM175 family protein [Methylocaldum sp.]|uniref:TMEM175 family protein n=1 Tax=Methylocaldum sp. TaxID=1969727 RepID=UPI002D30A927|nr:TMEM175 family protein [Methylocaldum sp.]HYE34506.1 TMEM175 family protein [Methylocaldum sp.]
MPKERLSPNSSGIFSLDRCKALADAVVAIVMTLLVLSIDVPSDHRFSEDGLFAFLERIGFDLFIYGVSFWLAGTYWVQHAAIMHHFRQGSRMLAWLNLLFLFPVTLLPFVTKLKSVYREEALVILLFGAVQILIGLALIALWTYTVSHPHLLIRPVEAAVRRRVTRRMFMSPVMVSVAAIPISFVNVHLGTLFFLSIPLYYLSHRVIDRSGSDPGMNGE